MDIEQKTDDRRPDRAVIICMNADDEHVVMLKEHYDAMKLPYTIIVEKETPDKAIDIQLYLGDELIDNLGCPHKG